MQITTRGGALSKMHAEFLHKSDFLLMPLSITNIKIKYKFL